MQVTIEEVPFAEYGAVCLDIRRIVFIEGQQVPEDEECDGLDEACRHFLTRLHDGAAIGTARVRYEEEIVCIERVAILPEYQGKGLGTQMMTKIIEAIRANHPPEITRLRVGAQVRVLSFYEGLGFKAIGEEYMDADMPHRKMVLEL